MNLYEVAVAAPVFGTLTYAQPEDDAALLPIGIRVLVPLRNRPVTGYLLALSSAEPTDIPYQVRPVFERLDPTPLFPEQLVPFFQWVAAYYHYPIGEVIRTALPAGLQVRAGHEILLTDAGRQHLPTTISNMKKHKQAAWMQRLLEKEKLLPGTAKTVRTTARTLLKKWQDAGWIEIREVLVEAGIREKTDTVVRLNPELQEQIDRYRVHSADIPSTSSFGRELKKSEQKTLELFCRHSSGQPVLPRTELTRRYSGAGRALRSLADAGLVTLEEQRVYRDPFGNVPHFFPKPEVLTPEQEKVISRINTAVDAEKFQPFLLHGVTGSGKTEVYLRAAERCLAQGKSVLVLVPEIALASQLEAHFYSRFGTALAVLHSGIAGGERFDQWQRVLEGQVRIVIGARSAVFAPFAEPGLIIVDEEHEPAYKQDDGLCYNGRDLAVLRAKFADCPVVLGSATPSVISFYHTEQGKYSLLTMKKRIHEQVMPRVEIVDLRKQPRSANFFFSDQLITAVRDNLAARQQTLLFVNRRGYASFMLCQECGYIIRCRHCRVSLTHHHGSNRLLCHYCGYSVSPDLVCPECRSGAVVGLGAGSERIEAEIRQLFPEAAVVRLDSDTAGDRKAYLQVLQQIRDHKVDILIGTQMVAKGLHFPAMTLVGVVWADSGLGLPDYKASERSFQLLAQVTGRAGRGQHPGRVIIQTHQPRHYVLEYACAHAYSKLYQQELTLRAELCYPPFGRLVNIRFSGKNEEEVGKAAHAVAAFLRAAGKSKSKEEAGKKYPSGQRDQVGQVDILGPVPAPLSMLKKRFRWQLLLKSSSPEQLHRLCDQLPEAKKRYCGVAVRMRPDVDPENMM